MVLNWRYRYCNWILRYFSSTFYTGNPAQSIASTMASRRTIRKLSGLFLLILMMINQTMLAPVNDDQATRRIHLQSALTIRENFICKQPQQRAYNLRELMQHLPSERTRQPVYIVLKRCDKYSGCCRSPDLSCAPVESSIYYEDIEIEMMSLAINADKKAPRERWIRVKQHGECTCQINDNQIDNEPPVVEILWSLRSPLDLSIQYWGRLKNSRVRQCLWAGFFGFFSCTVFGLREKPSAHWS